MEETKIIDDVNEEIINTEIEEPEIEEYPEETEEVIDGEEIPEAPITHDEEEAIEGTLEEE